jgi:glycosyltransferase involved in cell wall biosynthesis
MNGAEPKPPRVLLIHNFLSPYRVPLFRELAGRFDLDVWILGDVRSVREWPGDAPNAVFRYRVLPHVTVPLGSRYNVILVNYTLPFALARRRYDAIICCAWDTPAAFYAALHAHLTRTPFILWSGSTAAEVSRLRSMTMPLVRALVRSASAWLAYGTRAKDYLVSLGADRERTFLAYNTVEIDQFAAASRLSGESRAELKARLRIKTSHIALYCGNLLDLKGVPDLLDAFASFSENHRDVTLLLAGGARHRGPGAIRGIRAAGAACRVLRDRGGARRAVAKRDLGAGNQRGAGLRPPRHRHRRLRGRCGTHRGW